MMRAILIFSLLLMTKLSAISVETATLTAQPSQINLSQPTTLQLQHNSQETIPLKLLEQQLLIVGAEGQQAFTIRSSQQSPGKSSFLLDPWSPGEYTLTFGIIPLSDERVLDTGTVKIVVAPPPSGKEILQLDLLPLPGRPLIGVNPSTWEQLKAVETEEQTKRNQEIFRKRSLPWKVIGTLLLVALVLWFGRKQLKHLLQKAAITRIDPKEKALSALRQLAAADLPNQGQVEPFYVQLTSIVRHYIEGSFGIAAPEQTTEEFLLSAQKKQLFDASTQIRLTSFLQQADMVKFARSNASIEECNQAFSAAESLVERESTT